MLRLVSVLLLGIPCITPTVWAGSMGSPSSSYSTQRITVTETDLYNTTFKGEKILAKEVVCRTMWGTVMLPDGKGSYNVIAPINPGFIALSNIIPPLTDGPIYRPRLTVGKVIITK